MRNHIATQIKKQIPTLKPFKAIKLTGSTLNELMAFANHNTNQSSLQGQPTTINRTVHFQPSRRRSAKAPTKPIVIHTTITNHGQERFLVGLEAVLKYYESIGIDTAPYKQIELAKAEGMGAFFTPLFDDNCVFR